MTTRDYLVLARQAHAAVMIRRYFLRTLAAVPLAALLLPRPKTTKTWSTKGSLGAAIEDVAFAREYKKYQELFWLIGPPPHGGPCLVWTGTIAEFRDACLPQ